MVKGLIKKFIVITTSIGLLYSVVACQGTNNTQQQPPPPVNYPPGNGYGGYGYGYGGYPPGGGYPYGNGGYAYGAYGAGQPLPVGCMNGTMNCNMAMYNNYNAYGFMPYQVNPYAWGGYNNYYNMQYGPQTSGFMNFCNCPVGYRPVYNGAIGMGCLQWAYFQPYMGGAVYWGLQPNNYQWVNQQQIPNTQGYSNTTSCYGSVAQSCFTDQTGSCGAGAFCQVTAAGSRLGICVFNGSNGNGIPR